MKNKYGYKVGDHAIIVVDTHHHFKRGDVIKLRSDDGSYNPYWDKVNGSGADLDRVVDYGQIQSCNQYGWAVGDKGVVVGDSLVANKGDILTLVDDDGSSMPYFTGGTALSMGKVACRYSNLKRLIEGEASSLQSTVSTSEVRGYKFKVSSPEQSKRLQKVLFKLGYTWGYTSTEPMHLDSTDLYVNIRDKRLTKTSSPDVFAKHEYQERNIDWLIKLI